MNRPLNIITAIIPLFLIFNINTMIFADTSKEAADYLVELAEKAHKKGDVKESLIYIKKAFMVDPTNEKAKDLMKKAGFKQKDLTNLQNNDDKINYLNQNLQEYESRLNFLESKNKSLENELKNVSQSRDSLYDKIVDQELDTKESAQTLEQLTDHLSSREKDFERQLIKANLEYVDEKQKRAFLQKKFDEQKLTPQYDQQRIVYVPIEGKKISSDDLKRRYYRAIEESIRYEDILSQVNKKYFRIKDEVNYEQAIDREFMAVLEDNLEDNDSDLDNAKNDLVMTRIDLANYQHKHLDSLEKMIDLRESESVFQAVLEEKEKQVTVLEQDLEQSKEKLAANNDRLLRQDSKVASLESQLRAAKSEVEGLIKQREQFMNSIKHELKTLHN